MRTSYLLLPLCGAMLAQAQSQPQMTARELFYAAAPADAAPPSVKKKAPTKKPQERSEMAVAKTPAAPPVQPNLPPPPGVSAPPAAATNSIVIEAAMRTSAPPPASGTALGLKYTILKLEGSSMVPVAPNSVFHANDKIQFNVEANGPGYLYIVSRGSSGQWMPMFPSPEIAGGDNHIDGFHDYTMPPGYRYSFDVQTGDERVFLILSRDPKPDFEQLVYSLQDKVKPASDPKPAAPAPTAQPQHRMLVASNIADSTIDRFRQVYARDLVIEKVGDQPNSDSKEKAVFVVNATGASDSCVVADLTLAHR